ncbi:MAG: metallophosphoesterase, partial [Bacteroidales bacterium]|nr:metallophosphoesterase [Bacteroidales bacterium]
MRIIQFVIFFSIVLTVHTLINYYIFSRGLRSFEQGSNLRLAYIIGFWFLAISFFAGRILEKIYLSHLSDFFTWAGSFWLAAMLYLFLAVFIIDILRLVNYFIPFFSHFQHWIIFKKPQILTISIATVVFLVVLAGHINAIFPRLKTLDIDTGISSVENKKLRIVMASDIHLGTIISTKRVTRIVNMINEQKPDLVLFAGDIVDEDLAPVIKQNLGAILGTIKAPLGVIGSTGNHEYIGGANAAVEYLRSHKIIMLRDSAMKVAENVYVIGRDDIESMRFGGENRKPLSQIMENIPEGNFVIVLDHQPRAIEEAAAAGAGLTLSGHTHHGQLWPLNYITESMFPLSWGH